jgi:hypothetical protein
MQHETPMGIWMGAIATAGGLGDATELRETLVREAAVRERRRQRRRRWRLAIPRLGSLDIVWRPVRPVTG